jgi:hypothetical protein
MEYPDDMSESDTASTAADLEALRALQVDGSDLERIEELLDRYNVFEAIGFVDDEVMHSNFLAFLFDPKRNEGLKDLPIKGLLREALVTARKTPTMEREFDGLLDNLVGMDLTQTLVRREHYYIDVLLTNEDHKLAVIVENKIDAWEGPGQLDWYHRIIRHTHPGWTVVCIYLSPSGAAPSHEAYVPLSYGTLCDLLDRILEERGSALDPDVELSVEHYVRMVRRNKLRDPEIVELAQQIYQKHERAIELVYRHRPRPPDYPAQIRPIVEDLIRENPKLVLDLTSKDNIKFGVKDWDTPELLKADRWTESNRILLFIFYNRPGSLDLHLFMGPGPEATRQRLFEMAANHEVFVEPPPNDASTIRRRSWPAIFTRHFLKPESYEVLDQEQREREVRRRWNEFLHKDLPHIEAALRKETWIWEPVETDSV